VTSDPAAEAVALRMAAFADLLRDKGFAVGLGESEDALRIAASPLGARPALLRQGLKALLCTRPEDWHAFDDLFDAHWLGRGMKRAVRSIGSGGAPGPDLRRLAQQAAARSAGGPVDQVAAEGGGGDAAGGGLGRMEGASRRESLERTDFRRLHDPQAQAEANALAARLAARLRHRLTRRERRRRQGRRLDLRRTIRRNIAHGGLPIELVHRVRRDRPLRLVLLLDASGSMSLYTAVFLRFAHGILDAFREAEVFLFHTHLIHLSEAMRERDPARALDRLSLLAQGVGGGTRIGESLATFNGAYARRVLNSRSCVIIVSDGYDTGPPERLGQEMARLARRCRRIVWLNPMLGWEGYAPAARGLQAALPHVDLFAPAHSLASLAALEPYLARI